MQIEDLAPFTTTLQLNITLTQSWYVWNRDTGVFPK